MGTDKKNIPEVIMGFTNYCKDMNISIVHDERDDGLGYYIDFKGTNNDFSGTVYFTDDLNNAMLFSKSFASTHSMYDLVEDYEYSM